MKRLLVITLALLMVAPMAFGKKKRDKAGTLEGSTYQDDTYNFSLKIHDNWKVRIGDENATMRLVMTQKKYGIPTYYQNAQNYTKVPRVAVFADTISLAPMAFIDSLLSETYRSPYKTAILKELEIMGEPDLVTRNKAPLTVGGKQGAIWGAQTKFSQEIASGSGSGGTRVEVRHGGSIAVVKNGNQIIVFHMMCEWEFYETVQTEFLNMVNQLAFTEPKE